MLSRYIKIALLIGIAVTTSSITSFAVKDDVHDSKQAAPSAQPAAAPAIESSLYDPANEEADDNDTDTAPSSSSTDGLRQRNPMDWREMIKHLNGLIEQLKNDLPEQYTVISYLPDAQSTITNFRNRYLELDHHAFLLPNVDPRRYTSTPAEAQLFDIEINNLQRNWLTVQNYWRDLTASSARMATEAHQRELARPAQERAMAAGWFCLFLTYICYAHTIIKE